MLIRYNMGQKMYGIYSNGSGIMGYGKLSYYQAEKRYKFKISEVDERVKGGKITE